MITAAATAAGVVEERSERIAAQTYRRFCFSFLFSYYDEKKAKLIEIERGRVGEGAVEQQKLRLGARALQNVE